MKVACLVFYLLLHPLLASCGDDRQVFIVYLGEHQGDRAVHEIEEYHHSYLLSVKESEEDARDSLLYSYKNSINGFAAVLTPDQASTLSKLEEVVTVIRSDPTKYRLQTTRSWEFLGLEKDVGAWNPPYQSYYHGMSREGVLQRANFGSDVVVGVLDSGVWPESESFADEGMSRIPKSWKGRCQSGPGFDSSHCNRKLVGGRYYLKGYEHQYGPLNTTIESRSLRDLDGHGTHTASTIGGRRVAGASALGGFATGTAMGGAPLVRLAIYKACWAIPGQSKVDGNTCFEEDMLAAFDDAIADGVHVISASIGTSTPIGYASDGIAIGALHATKNNIVVVCAAGNSGPAPSTLSNPSPWIITVGASSLDRVFFSPVTLGNGQKIEGESATPEKLSKFYPLVYAGDVVAPGYPTTDIAGQCLPNSLSTSKVQGKIVLCIRGNGTRVGKGMEVKRAGGVGFILGNGPANGAEIAADAHVLPATGVTYNNSQTILNYIKSNKKPTAKLVPPKTLLHTKPAPSMASFTSRGPNVIDRNILKPDITAPGMNVLAAWSEGNSPTKLESDRRRVKYNLLSGTSMACPHVAAAAALLKAIHPEWSSAAVRSALMTTADQVNNKGLPITDTSGKIETPFSFGSGHLFPQRAVDPGLVYDAAYKDYICGLGIIQFDPKMKCPKKITSGYDLNYPSLQISEINGTVTVKRTVTNVGGAVSKYWQQSSPPPGFGIEIRPGVLLFNRVGQKKSFTISIERKGGSAAVKEGYSFGWYSWSDGIHTVRSPVAVSL